MNKFGLSLCVLLLLATFGQTAPPIVGQSEETKASAPAKPDASVKEIADLKDIVRQYQEQLQAVADAAKQVSLDEHAARHDHAMSQQVENIKLKRELAKLQQSAKN